MATLVTGGTGFVGCNIVRALVERGHEVVSYDLAAADDLLIRYLKPWADRITFVQGSITDIEALERVFASSNIDKVVHAAAYTTGVRGSAEQLDSRRVLETNIMGSVNLLEMARMIGVKRFLYVSSGSVYEGAESEGPLYENMPVRPKSLYRISKFASERIAERYHEIHDMDTVSVRLSQPYGPMDRISDTRGNLSHIFDWTGMAVRGEPIEVDPMDLDDVTYVMDIAHGLRTVLDAATLPNRLYNLATPVNTPTSQLVAAFLEAYPDAKFVKPIPEDTPPMTSFSMDVSRIKKDLGFEATTNYSDGLKAYFQWRIENNFTE